MESRQCGKHSCNLSVIGLGCWELGGGDYWGDVSQEDANLLIRKAVDMGVTYFDTAEVYNEGRSEQSLGMALKGIDREKVIIGSKVRPVNTEPDQLTASCEASLRRLQVEYLDIYMVHWPIKRQSIGGAKPLPSVEKAFDTLQKLRSQGKIRHIGVSNFKTETLQEALGFCPPIVVNQLPYSLISRAIEFSTLPFCQQQGIGIITYMTLMQGVLADVYPTIADVPLKYRRTRQFDSRKNELARHGGEGAEEEINVLLMEVRKMIQETGRSMADIAIQWALANPAVTCVLAGTRKWQNLQKNVNASLNPLPIELVEKLNLLSLPIKTRLGPGIDYFLRPEDDRT